MVKFLHLNKLSNINSPKPMIDAAKHMKSSIVIFLHKNGYKTSSQVMEWAAYN